MARIRNKSKSNILTRAMAHGRVVFLNEPLDLKKVTGPTVVAVQQKDLPMLEQEGLNFAFTMPYSSPQAPYEIIVKALDTFKTGQIAVHQIPVTVMSKNGKPKESGKLIGSKLSKMTRLSRKKGHPRILPNYHRPWHSINHIPIKVIPTVLPDGTVVLGVVVPEGQQFPKVVVEPIYKNDDRKPVKTLLKEPYSDEMITKALRLGHEGLFGKDGDMILKWKEDSDYHEKKFHDNHLMVCLFFYIYINKMYLSSDFYDGQRTAFYNYCKDHQPENFRLYDIRTFQLAISNLQHQHIGLDEYIRSYPKPAVKSQSLSYSVIAWNKMYQQCVPYFEKAFQIVKE